MKRIILWFFYTLLIIGYILIHPLLPGEIYFKWFYGLLLGCFLAIVRLAAGPAAADRAAAVKIISVLVMSFCGVIAVFSGSDIYIDIAIAWCFQAFIATIIFAKYIGGRHLGD